MRSDAVYNCHRPLKAFLRDGILLRETELRRLREKRDGLRRTIRKALADGPRPVAFHMQGSFAMRTVVRFDDNLDLDDGVYFDAADLVGPRGAEVSSLAARDMICDALQRFNWNNPPEVLKNCVRVQYEQGFHVDLPIYRRRRDVRRANGLIHIGYRYELAGATWKPSAPQAVTEWFRAKNKKLSPDGDQFRRIVCYLKAIARSRASWTPLHPSGFVIAKLASETYFASDRDDIALYQTMQRIVRRVAEDPSVKHPIFPRDEITANGEGRVVRFGVKLNEMLEWLEVLGARSCTHEEALASWDFVFGHWILDW